MKKSIQEILKQLDKETLISLVVGNTPVINAVSEIKSKTETKVESKTDAKIVELKPHRDHRIQKNKTTNQYKVIRPDGSESETMFKDLRSAKKWISIQLELDKKSDEEKVEKVVESLPETSKPLSRTSYTAGMIVEYLQKFPKGLTSREIHAKFDDTDVTVKEINCALTTTLKNAWNRSKRKCEVTNREVWSYRLK